MSQKLRESDIGAAYINNYISISYKSAHGTNLNLSVLLLDCSPSDKVNF